MTRRAAENAADLVTAAQDHLAWMAREVLDTLENADDMTRARAGELARSLCRETAILLLFEIMPGEAWAERRESLAAALTVAALAKAIRPSDADQQSSPAAPEAATGPDGWLENLHDTAGEVCASVATQVLARVLDMQPDGREMEAAYGLIRDISAEIADTILFPLAQDDAERAARCQAIAASALDEAQRECAARGRGA
ncbi:hypothetical protein [Pseudoroseomonas cervicalis]|uniref:hypothetical protein n=1 Tax=Teichococcus cervicalis TaxID=204525 RepID=UPI0022F1C791|nr:hypothetical protein [Pseudoroseomonas cervicalis]WBV44027.1 hypothetical protein PFY06_05525 [Pseudoroseomonas cervicalis]